MSANGVQARRYLERVVVEKDENMGFERGRVLSGSDGLRLGWREGRQGKPPCEIKNSSLGHSPQIITCYLLE